MTTMSRQKKEALDFFQAALHAVDPYAAVSRHIHFVTDVIRDEKVKNLAVIGFGKAAFAMAKSAVDELRPHIASGIIITKYDHIPDPKAIHPLKAVEASHPLPDEQGVLGAREVLRMLSETDKKTLVLCLISGGGSALMASPADGISLKEKQIATNLLLRAGANINELNAVRKHISAVKGGRLAEAAYPSPVISLILSDVIGDPLDVIASGPTAPDESTYADAIDIIRRYGLWEDMPQTVLTHLMKGANGELPETPKRNAPVFDIVNNHIVGSNALAVEAARRAAESSGYKTTVLSTTLSGEASRVAATLAEKAKEIRQKLKPNEKVCLVAGGETTVTVKGNGRGGRNTEMALAFATYIKGIDGITFLSAGTDGVDGTADAAGALVNGSTVPKALEQGLDPVRYLTDNDSYTFFKNLGDGLVVTGPTGTNVMDIQILLIEA
jgi:glycerate-2-kinase